MGKKIFLLLPEAYDDARPCSYFPRTYSYYRSKNDDDVLLNVYEHYRSFYEKRKATVLSMEMLHCFNELWYYGAYGITEPMHCIIKCAQQHNIPIKDLQPISCKDSFSLVYKIAMQFHPSKKQDDKYWSEITQSLGEYTKDGNPLNICLLVSITEYYETIFRGTSPAIQPDNLFKGEFRAAMDFARWAIKSNADFHDGIDLAKVSKNQKPTPMLQALMDGFYNYYKTRQKNLELNKF